MFSADEKRKIAQAVEDVIREINHPEMDNDNIHFQLHIDGKESWSWADIRENRKDDPQKSPNDWNEISREAMSITEDEAREMMNDVIMGKIQLPQKMSQRYSVVTVSIKDVSERNLSLSQFSKIASALTPEEKSAIHEFLDNPEAGQQIGEEFHADILSLLEQEK